MKFYDSLQTQQANYAERLIQRPVDTLEEIFPYRNRFLSYDRKVAKEIPSPQKIRLELFGFVVNYFLLFGNFKFVVRKEFVRSQENTFAGRKLNVIIVIIES